MKRLSVLLAMVLILGLLPSCGTKTPATLTPVKLMLDWVPNTNDTGIYVAQAKGYFAD